MTIQSMDKNLIPRSIQRSSSTRCRRRFSKILIFNQSTVPLKTNILIISEMQYSKMFQNRTSCLGRSSGATTHPLVTFRVCRTISRSLSIHIRNLFSKRRSLTANILIPKKQASKCLNFQKTVFYRNFFNTFLTFLKHFLTFLTFLKTAKNAKSSTFCLYNQCKNPFLPYIISSKNNQNSRGGGAGRVYLRGRQRWPKKIMILRQKNLHRKKRFFQKIFVFQRKLNQSYSERYCAPL